MANLCLVPVSHVADPLLRSRTGYAGLVLSHPSEYPRPGEYLEYVGEAVEGGRSYVRVKLYLESPLGTHILKVVTGSELIKFRW